MLRREHRPSRRLKLENAKRERVRPDCEDNLAVKPHSLALRVLDFNPDVARAHAAFFRFFSGFDARSDAARLHPRRRISTRGRSFHRCGGVFGAGLGVFAFPSAAALSDGENQTL